MNNEEYMKKLYDRIKINPFPRENGVYYEEISEGYTRAALAVEEKHHNPIGSVHGGCLFMLADITACTAAMTYGQTVTTADSTIHYLRAGLNAKKIVAEAKVVKRGKRLVIVNCDVMDENGKVLATSIFSCMIIDVADRG